MTKTALQFTSNRQYFEIDPVALSQIIDMLAPALSHGRRQQARLVTGPDRQFFTSKNCSQVYVPFPVFDHSRWVTPLRFVTCGLALQASPSKEVMARLPLQDLNTQELIALILVEGEIAMAWAISNWPGLEVELRHLLAPLEPCLEPYLKNSFNPCFQGDVVIDGNALVEQALYRVRQNQIDKYTVLPPLLGHLPMAELQRRSLSSLFRGKGRMPYGFRKIQRVETLFAIPVGGSGGVRSKNIPPPSNADEPEVRRDRRIGIPYDEWNMHSRRYRRDHVSVIERHAPLPSTVSVAPPSDIMRWFRQSTTSNWHNRLEDGTDIDLDAYINQYAAEAAGLEADGRIYRCLTPGERDVATALLLDGSASLGIDGGLHLKLQLACADALTTSLTQAQEPHAVFAFTGNTRHRVEVSVLKDFNEPRAVMPGRTGLQTAGYTRLGAPLRHVTRRLLEVPAERRILLSLGDGLPSDEGYEGRYAWADVAKAVEESVAAGVIVYHIGVGRVKIDPLNECFGVERSQRVRSVRDLPRILSQVHSALSLA